MATLAVVLHLLRREGEEQTARCIFIASKFHVSLIGRVFFFTACLSAPADAFGHSEVTEPSPPPTQRAVCVHPAFGTGEHV